MAVSTLALLTSIQTTASLKCLGVSVFYVLKGVILSEIDSRNGPIKFEYFSRRVLKNNNAINRGCIELFDAIKYSSFILY